MAKAKYDEDVDALLVRKEGEPIAFSINILENFILDVDSSRKIVGLEILNASKVLNIPKSELKELKGGSISTLIMKEFYGAKYSLLFPKERVESQIAVPVGAAMHVARK